MLQCRVSPVGRNIDQRSQGILPIRKIVIGYHKPLIIKRLVAIKNYVDIDRSRGILLALGELHLTLLGPVTPKLGLDEVDAAQHLVGILGGEKLATAVYEAPLGTEAIGLTRMLVGECHKSSYLLRATLHSTLDKVCGTLVVGAKQQNHANHYCRRFIIFDTASAKWVNTMRGAPFC